MKNRNYNLFLLVMILMMLLNTANADTKQDQEYKIKAAFLYNFIKFIDWPPTKSSDEKTISIGIIGVNPFGKAFEPVKDKQVGNKKIVVQLFNSLDQSKLTDEKIANIKNCQVLFICNSEKKYFKEIIDLIKDDSVLTVGDTDGFLEAGGIIDFLIEDQKVCFEISNYSAKQAKLNIRSQLLRLAKKVVEEKQESGNTN